jgi:hypothetical protein
MPFLYRLKKASLEERVLSYFSKSFDREIGKTGIVFSAKTEALKQEVGTLFSKRH